MNHKHISLCLLLPNLLGLSSCGNTQTKPADTTDIEIEVVEKATEHHPEEDKVIADLSFFISKNDFKKNEKKYLEKIFDEKLNKYHIGNYDAVAYATNSYFENDSLYYVEFEGQSYDIDNYEGKLIPQYNELRKIYESKYGKPIFQIISFPRSYETNDGYKYELSRWDLGKRSISIKLAAGSTSHRINLAIFRNDINDRIKERKQKESKERQESAASVI